MAEKRARVTIAINVDEGAGASEVKIFETSGTTEGDLFDLADGLLSAAYSEANRWVSREGSARRNGR
jgi:hypothetical protein